MAAGVGAGHRRPGRCRHSATEGLAITESGIEPTKDAAAFKLPLCTLQLPAAAPRRGALVVSPQCPLKVHGRPGVVLASPAVGPADTAPWYYHDVKCERASTL
jgi:hypothetical protein